MVITPCSMKTLAGIRVGYADTLLVRAADVTIKEHRPLVVVPRETPLSEIHLDKMLILAHIGVRIVPPMPAFYNTPESIDDPIKHMVTRMLDQFALPAANAQRWQGLPNRQPRPVPATDKEATA
jgi:flavin prenyltransferase